MSTEGVDAAVVLAQDVKRRFSWNPDVVCGREGRLLTYALLAVNPGGPVLLSPDGKLSAWEPPTLTDEERHNVEAIADGLYESPVPAVERLLAIIDRLAPPPVQQEEARDD